MTGPVAGTDGGNSTTDVLLAGIDGGNSKTDVLLAGIDGRVVALVRGAGSNLHAIGAPACAGLLAELVTAAGARLPVAAAACFLCGVDLPGDAERAGAAIRAVGLAAELSVENDAFALTHLALEPVAGCVALVCGAGVNAAGRSAGGRSVCYPTFGPETGYWGGSEMLGREVLFHATRAEDGRGEPTGLLELVRRHFGAASALEVGLAVVARRIGPGRLGELAPGVLALAEDGDAVAGALVARLARELALLTRKAVRDLSLEGQPVEVVLGGGMLVGARPALRDAVVADLAAIAPLVRPHRAELAPVVGAALAALDLAGAPPAARHRLLHDARCDDRLSCRPPPA